MRHLNSQELAAGLGHILNSPHDAGLIEMIVVRPGIDERRLVETVELREGEGAVGDSYVIRGNSSTPDGAADPEAQLTLMNARVVDLVSDGDRRRWPLAGDQILVDLDLSVGNLPPGARLALGTAVVEVSAQPHTGCAKFSRRYGVDARRWINSDPELRLRGLNAKIVTSGHCSVGQVITKV